MSAPWSWVRRITSDIEELKEIPLFGNAPPFDWAHFSKILTSHLKIGEIQIEPKQQGILEGLEVKGGLGMNPYPLSINVAPLGDVVWVMSENDREKLTLTMLKTSQKSTTTPSELLQEGFYRFLMLEVLLSLGKIPPLSTFTCQYSEKEPEIEKAFYIDVQIRIEDKSCWGRLLIPWSFRKKWVEHFSTFPSEYIPRDLAKETYVSIGIKTGSVILAQDEISGLQPGDFVLLDKASYDAHRGTGVCMLMLQSTPLFNAKIKQNKVELIDYAFYYEDNMEENVSSKTPEIPETPEMPNMQGEKKRAQSFPSEEAEAVAIKEMPLNVTVEIGRLRISLDQLMQLTPGNLLELPIHPDQGVNLTVGGQKIGTAELVYLGEQLGIRILEI